MLFNESFRVLCLNYQVNVVRLELLKTISDGSSQALGSVAGKVGSDVGAVRCQLVVCGILGGNDWVNVSALCGFAKYCRCEGANYPFPHDSRDSSSTRQCESRTLRIDSCSLCR